MLTEGVEAGEIMLPFYQAVPLKAAENQPTA
jgi:hypothetical protein